MKEKTKRKKKQSQIKISKFFLLFAVFSFVVIMVRGTQLSLSKKIDGITLKDFANARTTKRETLLAKRGTIRDRNGNVLAQTVSSYTVIAYLDPNRTEDEEHPKHVVDKEYTAKKLSPILGIEEERILELLSKENTYQTEFGSKGKGLTEMTKDKIVALNLPGIDFIESQKRNYPMGDFLSYTIGYAKENDDGVLEGEMGIEKYYNDILSGEDGFIEYQKDLKGYKIPNTKEQKQEAVNGKDVYLTIDSNIQFFVEQALKTAGNNYTFDWLTMVVADAKTGEILASSSVPSFDPNIRNITNYLDPAVASPYEPGSTMKTFTYMVAMENGVYHGDDTYMSGTYTTTDGTVIGDWDKNGWGVITFDKGYAMSSNVGIINIIKDKLSRQALRDYFKKLGFGVKTGIELPQEAKGKINFRYETELYNAGFGQGITTTPMQNIKALTTLTNSGTLLKPYLVSKIIDPITEKIEYTGKRKELDTVASTNTINKILSLMDDTVNGIGNTGAGFRMGNHQLIGKTGTAQIADENGSGYLSGVNDVISSFAGIYPKDDPKIIVYTSVKRPEGGKATLLWNAVKEIVVNVDKYLGVTDNSENNENIKEYQLLSYMNKDIEEAKKELESNNIPVVILGNGTKIIDQYPDIGTKITSKDKIFLKTNGKEITMPNLIGWSLKDAMTFLELSGIKSHIDGYGYVIEQSISENTLLTEEMEITLKLTPKFNLNSSSSEDKNE